MSKQDPILLPDGTGTESGKADGSKFRSKIGIAATLLLIAVYFAVWFFLSTNVPYADDVGRMFGFLMELEQKPTLAEQAEYTLTHQTNEHRIVVFRLVFLALLNVFGYINLKHLMLVGSIALVGIFVLLYKSIRIDEHKLYYLLPVALLLFVPLHQISDWGLNLTAYVVYFFAFGSLWSLHRSNERRQPAWFLVAILFAVLAAFTFGSGLFVFFAAYVLLVLPRICWWKLMVWTGVMVATFAIYFHNLDIPAHRPSLIANLQANSFSSIGFFFAFAGAACKDLFHSPIPQTLIGLGLVGLMVFTLGKRVQFFRESPLLVSMLAYLLIFFVPTAINRGYMGLAIANADRYQIVPALFLCICFLICLAAWPQWVKRNFGFVLAFSLVLFASRLTYNTKAMDRHRDRQHGNLLEFHLGNGSHKLTPHIMQNAIDKGYYHSPAKDIWTLPEVQSIEVPQGNIKVRAGLRRFVDQPDWAHAIGYALFEKTRSRNPRKFLLLTSEETEQSFTIGGTIIPDLSFVEAEGMPRNEGKFYNPQNAGFLIVVNKRELDIPNGKYRVGILMREQDQVGVRYLDEVLNLNMQNQSNQPIEPATPQKKQTPKKKVAETLKAAMR